MTNSMSNFSGHNFKNKSFTLKILENFLSKTHLFIKCHLQDILIFEYDFYVIYLNELPDSS